MYFKKQLKVMSYPLVDTILSLFPVACPSRLCYSLLVSETVWKTNSFQNYKTFLYFFWQGERGDFFLHLLNKKLNICEGVVSAFAFVYKYQHTSTGFSLFKMQDLLCNGGGQAIMNNLFQKRSMVLFFLFLLQCHVQGTPSGFLSNEDRKLCQIQIVLTKNKFCGIFV